MNIWPSRGTVLVQGGDAPRLERELKLLLGEKVEHMEPLPDCAWQLFVDGSCPANKLAGKMSTAAGWGVAIFQLERRGRW